MKRGFIAALIILFCIATQGQPPHEHGKPPTVEERLKKNK